MIARKKFLLLFLVFIAIPALALADFSARVVKVKDGDTVVVLYDNHIPVNLRLQKIDAPELGQRFGKEAKKYASDLLYNQTVTVREGGVDKYYRLLGELTLPDGRDFSEEMLRAGYAWHYKQYDQSQKLADLENEAHDAQRGLWVDLDPTPPWEFRRTENSDNGPAKIRSRERGTRRSARGVLRN
ncbi:MAG: thermonuclease family protein [Nitrospirota bacterium]